MPAFVGTPERDLGAGPVAPLPEHEAEVRVSGHAGRPAAATHLMRSNREKNHAIPLSRSIGLPVIAPANSGVTRRVGVGLLSSRPRGRVRVRGRG